MSEALARVKHMMTFFRRSLKPSANRGRGEGGMPRGYEVGGDGIRYAPRPEICGGIDPRVGFCQHLSRYALDPLRVRFPGVFVSVGTGDGKPDLRVACRQRIFHPIRRNRARSTCDYCRPDMPPSRCVSSPPVETVRTHLWLPSGHSPHNASSGRPSTLGNLCEVDHYSWPGGRELLCHIRAFESTTLHRV